MRNKDILSKQARAGFAVGALSVGPQQFHEELCLALREVGVGGEEEVEHVVWCRHSRPQEVSALLHQHLGHLLEDDVVLGRGGREHQVVGRDCQLLQGFCYVLTKLRILVPERSKLIWIKKIMD